jgi:hypothetical protein
VCDLCARKKPGLTKKLGWQAFSKFEAPPPLPAANPIFGLQPRREKYAQSIFHHKNMLRLERALKRTAAADAAYLLLPSAAALLAALCSLSRSLAQGMQKRCCGCATTSDRLDLRVRTAAHHPPPSLISESDPIDPIRCSDVQSPINNKRAGGCSDSSASFITHSTASPSQLITITTTAIAIAGVIECPLPARAAACLGLRNAVRRFEVRCAGGLRAERRRVRVSHSGGRLKRGGGSGLVRQ